MGSAGQQANEVAVARGVARPPLLYLARPTSRQRMQRLADELAAEGRSWSSSTIRGIGDRS
jgi:hypothetical protein